MAERISKINKLIKRHASDIILKELSFKEGVFLTVVKVDTTPDLRYARIFVSVYPEENTNYALESLKKEIYKIQGEINKRLAMRPLPRVEFRLDTTESKADIIEKILKEVKKN